MPLPGAVLFPHALLPLYIFEPRYRAMLEHALAEHRMFCVALINPNRTEWNSVDDFRHTATVGLIRACVGRADGTSNLILQGLQRVRFASFLQAGPFPIAEIEPLESEPADPPCKAKRSAQKFSNFTRNSKEAAARSRRKSIATSLILPIRKCSPI